MTVCRKSYIDPRIIDLYTSGSLAERLAMISNRVLARHERAGFSRHEALFLGFLTTLGVDTARPVRRAG